MLTQEQITRKLHAVDNAIAQQTLEGLKVSDDVIVNLYKAAHGEMTLEDCLKIEAGKYKNAKIRRGRSLHL